MNINNLKKYVLVGYYNNYENEKIVFGWKIIETFDTIEDCAFYQIKNKMNEKSYYRVMKNISIGVSFSEK